MPEPIIRVENLGKKYQIQHQEGGPGYRALRDVLGGWVKTAGGLLRGRWPRSKRTREEFWALKDVSFDIQEGDVVGIIGRNGAGKSTLLKILSRITEPSAGRVTLNGRVASLMEVGTGFHPELTGRENIYLNGSILGMKRREIERKFDEIVAFSGVEKFLDTPVKRYSSGMYVRLAFAVAAHLEPEILVVDEVLAVGDAQFQKKCLDKMQDVGQGGRTILFVSHNMSALRAICKTSLLLERGRVIEGGETNSVVDRYLAETEWSDHAGAETLSAVILGVEIYSTAGPVIKTYDTITVRVRLRAKTEICDPGLYVGFLTAENQRVAGLDYKDFRSIPPMASGSEAVLGFTIDNLPLLPGSYALELHVKDMASLAIELVPASISFTVVETPVYGGRKLGPWFGLVGLKATPLYEAIQP